MKDASSFNKLYLSMYFRGLNKKSFIINTVLYTLPIILLLMYSRKFSIGFELITMLSISSFIVIYFKGFITSIFSYDDYEMFLAYPVRFKDLFFIKSIKFYVDILIKNTFLLIAYIFNGILTSASFNYYIYSIVVYLVVPILLIVFSYIIVISYYAIKRIPNRLQKISISMVATLTLMLVIFKTNILSDIFLFEFLFLRYKYANLNSIIMLTIIVIILVGIYIILSLSTSSLYRNIIEDLAGGTKTYKKTEYKSLGVLKRLVICDIKKILRNQMIYRTMIVGFLILFFMMIISLVFVKEAFMKINPATMMLFYILYGQILSGGIFAPMIAFSKDGMDQSTILSMPVDTLTYIKSRVISSLLVSLVGGCIIGLTTIMFYKAGIVFIFLNIVSCILAIMSFSMITIYFDIKEVKFDWITLNDLENKYYKALFTVIGISSISTLPLYVLSSRVSWINIYLVTLIYGLFHLLIIKITYKKIIKIGQEVL